MELDIKGIMERLPHRYPMLLIDRVVEMVPGKSIVAIKNVSINEPFFTGHFPHHPVMPGVLIVEAMAQAAALFSFTDADGGLKCDGKTAYYRSASMMRASGVRSCRATSCAWKSRRCA